MSRKYWDVVPVTNWMQQSVAQLNFMTCGLVYQRKIQIVDLTPGAYRIPVSYHDCQEYEPLERCADCYADWVDGKIAFEAESEY
jgi:hypothetical protein